MRYSNPFITGGQKHTHTPTTKASTGLQADNDHRSILNDVTSSQAVSAVTATSTAIMTQVPTITTAITKVTIKLDKCFLHLVKTGANNTTNKSESFLLHALFGSAITTARIHTSSLLLLYVHDNPEIMTALNAQNLLLFFVHNNPATQASKLIAKYFNTSLYFRKDCSTFVVRENWCNTGNMTNTTASLASALLVTLILSRLTGFDGLIGLVKFISLNILIGLVGFIGRNGLIGLIGLISLITGLVGLVSLIDCIGHIRRNGCNSLVGGIGLISCNGLISHVMLVKLISPVGLIGLNSFIGRGGTDKIIKNNLLIFLFFQ
jgi:hypothetical protein